MEKPKIRPFENEDRDDVWQLHVDGLKETGSYLDNPDLDADLRNIKEVYLDEQGEFFVASEDEKIIGMGALRKVNEETAEVKRMRTHPEYRGRGVGSVILDRLIEKARELGYKKLILDTTDKQEAAKHLYESRGFREYDRKKSDDMELVFYELSLEGSGKNIT